MTNPPLPPIYGITAVAICEGIDEFLGRLERAIADGLRMLQVRDKQLSGSERKQLAIECVSRMHDCGGKVLINDDASMAAEIGADGVHVSSRLITTTRRKDLFGMIGVSCHNATELDGGLVGLDADFAVLSPVLRTLSHVDAEILGWDGFAELAARHAKPIYALGGLEKADLARVQSFNATGLASMRDVWGIAVADTERTAKETV